MGSAVFHHDCYMFCLSFISCHMSFAGAGPDICSNLSDNSTISESISRFVKIQHVHEIGYLKSYDRLESVFSHWVWASGMRKGQKLEANHAEALLRVRAFDRNRLEPVYVDRVPLLDAESIEMQNLLGETRVDEYGTFVPKPSSQK